MSKYVLTFVDYLYNPHSNKSSTPTQSMDTSSSSSSSSSELAYTSSGSFTDEDSNSSSSSSTSSSSRIRRYHRSRSGSSSSLESYYDDKNFSLIWNHTENEDKVMSIVAERFNVKKEGLHSTYLKFKTLVYDPSDKGHLFCGLRLLSSQLCLKYGIKQYDDSEYACLFHNIHHHQAGLVHLIDNSSQKYDTYIVDQQLHDSLYYTITRALVSRIISILRKMNNGDLSLESKNLIKALKDEMPDIYTKYSTSHIHCKQRHDTKENRNKCMNTQVIYTKTTSKLYTFIKGSLLSTKLGILDGLENLKFDECELALPIPFYLVLFLCGKVEGFRSEFNMKLNHLNNNMINLVPTVNDQQGNSIIDFEGNSVDRYIDYEKWVCLPSWCLVMYQNAK